MTDVESAGKTEVSNEPAPASEPPAPAERPVVQNSERAETPKPAAPPTKEATVYRGEGYPRSKEGEAALVAETVMPLKTKKPKPSPPKQKRTEESGSWWLGALALGGILAGALFLVPKSEPTRVRAAKHQFNLPKREEDPPPPPEPEPEPEPEPPVIEEEDEYVPPPPIYAALIH